MMCFFGGTSLNLFFGFLHLVVGVQAQRWEEKKIIKNKINQIQSSKEKKFFFALKNVKIYNFFVFHWGSLQVTWFRIVKVKTIKSQLVLHYFVIEVAIRLLIFSHFIKIDLKGDDGYLKLTLRRPEVSEMNLPTP